MPDLVPDTIKLGSEIDLDIREGRFQRWLALIAGLSSVLSGLEVTYEHYRGSYSRRVMYTPVILSGTLAVGGFAGFFSKRAARTVLPVISVITLGDSLIGFYFHVRGSPSKTRRLASSHRQHGDGAAHLRAAPVWRQCLSGLCCFLSSSR